MEILLGILIIFIFILIYGLKNSLKKIEAYEDKQTETLLLLNHLLLSMRELDNKQLFEKDDEVGAVFDQLKEIIQFYSKLIS